MAQTVVKVSNVSIKSSPAVGDDSHAPRSTTFVQQAAASASPATRGIVHTVSPRLDKLCQPSTSRLDWATHSQCE